MDIRILDIFLHLTESLHFGRTSSVYNMTPSTLTRAIQRLEEEVGKPLFHRNNRSVSLTPAGILFQKYAEESRRLWLTFQDQLAATEDLNGSISLYCSVTAANSILPAILNTFRSQHPGIQLLLQTGDAAMALPKLLANEADITIAALPEKLPASIATIKVTETPLVFIAPVEYPDILRIEKGQIDWSNTPIILAEQGLSRERMDRWFRTNAIRPNIYAQVAGNEALLTMVSLGCGVGVIPLLVLEKSLMRHQVQVIESAPELSPFSIGVCTISRRLETPLIKAFWETVLHQQG
ncbi:HTH-type transcriptional activator IlvY [Desulfogranum japonicum]|uniref:HTH-type transcriptional activator IlvY n=1 Tax=Desulfogranum japonicum TaxID=231447 RepID=UPI000425694F|nr:HTH-type transcriptional activator IlvY [Desulfogranum japonicum]